MKTNEFKEYSWRRLLSKIERGQIIPIIGSELLIVNVNGKNIPLYNWIAMELALRLDIDINGIECPDISDVFYQYKMRPNSRIDDAYSAIELILEDADFEIPEALKILAGIDNFKLFISTTFDSFMERALSEAGRNFKSLKFLKTEKGQDIEIDEKGPVVYHIFGKADALPTYVATEDDLLDFTQKWNDPDRRPDRLNSILKDKENYYMLLGCSFENWLTRFFLYGLNNLPIQEGVVADNKSNEDEKLALFLSRCNANLYTSDNNIENAIQFIKELGVRWENRIKSNTHAIAPSVPIVKSSVFLSYASEDKALAKKICDELRKRNIDVWFDENKIKTGSLYMNEITQSIEQSSLFIPLITKNTITEQRRFFRSEWSEAIAEMSYRPDSIPFIMPIVTDDVPENELLIPEKIRKIHWYKLRNENQQNIDSDIQLFADICLKAVKNYRRTKK